MKYFLSCLGVGYVIRYAELCKNLKHIGFFTHIAKCVRLGRYVDGATVMGRDPAFIQPWTYGFFTSDI